MLSSSSGPAQGHSLKEHAAPGSWTKTRALRREAHGESEIHCPGAPSGYRGVGSGGQLLSATGKVVQRWGPDLAQQLVPSPASKKSNSPLLRQRQPSPAGSAVGEPSRASYSTTQHNVTVTERPPVFVLLLSPSRADRNCIGARSGARRGRGALQGFTADSVS